MPERPIVASPALRLFIAGAAILFWELALIRWLGSNARIVAYYSNFVLTAAFFGLGLGALLGRHEGLRLHRFALPILAACVLIGLGLGGQFNYNPRSVEEFVWVGAPLGVLVTQSRSALSMWALLTIVYAVTAAAFLAQGHTVGLLFKRLPPLRAYSVEIAGSLAGILLFGLMALFELPPTAWFAVGAALVFPLLERRPTQIAGAVLGTAVLLVAAKGPSQQFLWSPYYKISVQPIDSIFDLQLEAQVETPRRFGHALTVNNDYHQMMLDLKAPDAHPFVRSWRDLYDAPYRQGGALPPGPILIVGAGTGNDVSAALRSTDRAVHAVEIDPAILRLGKGLHAEAPYANPRVTVVNDDARAFFERATDKYAMIVFGFLDSHTLLSSFSSVRLDNFVYTEESIGRARSLLVPGGRVFLTFASNTPWIHQRLVGLLDQVFGQPTLVLFPRLPYANGVVYQAIHDPTVTAYPGDRIPRGPRVEIPTDDWPFLYLRQRTIPAHYWSFIAVIVLLGASSLLLLPRGERRLRLPYFLLGAAFFLLETTNVVRLSLLFGSTWWVNVLVFSGILALVLLANLTRMRTQRLSIHWIIGLLVLNVLAGYFVAPPSLLAIDAGWLRAIAAIAVYLGPVYFAGLLFATLIEKEERFFEAYGSNVLGAMVGGAAEYLSLVVGFKALLLLTLAFYLTTYLLLVRGRSGLAA